MLCLLHQNCLQTLVAPTRRPSVFTDDNAQRFIDPTRADIRHGGSRACFVPSLDIIAAFPEQTRAARNPLSLRVKLSHEGAVHEIGLVPDLVFGLQLPDGSRHSFMVEIDRGTMPIARSDFLQTSFEWKNARLPHRTRRETTREAFRMEDFRC